MYIKGWVLGEKGLLGNFFNTKPGKKIIYWCLIKLYRPIELALKRKLVLWWANLTKLFKTEGQQHGPEVLHISQQKCLLHKKSVFFKSLRTYLHQSCVIDIKFMFWFVWEITLMHYDTGIEAQTSLNQWLAEELSVSVEWHAPKGDWNPSIWLLWEMLERISINKSSNH